MEASALHAPALARRSLPSPLLRLRSDEQLVAMFRAGQEEAFTAIHDRYRQRLFAYVRQMLSSATRADAEDVLQDVFVRAYGALRADGREVALRAWLYRVAHNRCIDHLRRPTPPAGEVFDMSRTPLQDPMETAQRRDDLRRLVADVGRLPEQQRSALLMREIDGLSYADISAALDVTVPAVKSLLVRARIGLVEAAEARDTDCAVIRGDLASAYDRGVKASARARRHMRECAGCREYREALRGVRRSFAALAPAGGLGPLAVLAKALGIGGASGGAAAGGAGIAGGGAAAVTACKVAAAVCTAVVATGGAVEVSHELTAPAPRHASRAHSASTHRRATVLPAHAATVAQPVRLVVPSARPHAATRPVRLVVPAPAKPARDAEDALVEPHGGAVADSPTPAPPPAPTEGSTDETTTGVSAGGTPAPTETAGAAPTPVPTQTPPVTVTPAPAAATTPPDDTTAPTDQSGSASGGSVPPAYRPASVH